MSMWGLVEAAADNSVDYASRLRDLSRRHLVNRMKSSSPETLAKYPPLTEEEQAERDHLSNWSQQLYNRWDDMDPTMTPEEIAAHTNLNGMLVNGQRQLREPDNMNTRQKAIYYSDLHHQWNQGEEALTKRQEHHMDQMTGWADQHFGNMQNDANDELDRWKEYDQHGTHPGGSPTLMETENNHHPDLTGAWAHEEANGDDPHLSQRASEYGNALKRVASDPLGRSDGQYHHQSLEDARNNLRVELQHRGRFTVPSVDQLSRVNDPSEARSGGHLNPRFNIGMGVAQTGNKKTDAAAERAYKVNCQRSMLASEARHRGYNVEAQRNFQPGGLLNDKNFADHDIAAWFQHPDGSQAKWHDVEDEFPDAKMGASQWDLMHKQIQGWGEGARGMVAVSYPRRTSKGYARHVISAHVGPGGKVNYHDPQSGEDNVENLWRKSLSYRAFRSHKPVRQRSRSRQELGEVDPVSATTQRNSYYSPLRYMRTDDKELHPDVSRYMVDRGTATDKPILPPETAQPEVANMMSTRGLIG